MKRAVFYQYGGPEVMQLEDVPVPTLRTREVLVKMISTSINGADLIQRRGTMTLNNRFPKTAGLDVVGQVVKLGSHVDEFKVGDIVWGNINVLKNAAAEYVACPVRNITLLPDNIDPVKDAALPTTAVTAITVLLDKGHLKPGESVLIRGIGGVGLTAVQIAHAYGAQVVTLGSQDGDQLKQYGASKSFDYHNTNLNQLGTFDLIFDTVGGNLAPYRKLLSPNGRILTIATNSHHFYKDVMRIIGSYRYGKKRTRMVIGYPSKRRLQILNRLVEEQKIEPVIDKIYPFSQIVEANRRADQHGLLGKVILKMGE